MLLLSLKDLAVSTGSACTSASLLPSYVLKEIGLTDEQALARIGITELGGYACIEGKTELQKDFFLD